MNNNKHVSIIIPIFNEKKYIRQLLNSLLQQDYPKERLEILLIDGRSEDGTREEINDVIASSPEFSELDIHITIAGILCGGCGSRILKTGSGWCIQNSLPRMRYHGDILSRLCLSLS